MRLKQKAALLLSGVMLAGTISMVSPADVEAAYFNAASFNLSVPADTNITAAGWNNIGSVGVSDVTGLNENQVVAVTIDGGATGRNLVNKADASQKVGYEIKKGDAAKNEAFGEKIEFTKDGTQAIGAVVADYSGAAAGVYEDTINFTASFVDNTIPVTGVTLEENEITIKVGETKKISVKSITPENATYKSVQYITRDSSIISYSAMSGEVKGLKPGTATVTVLVGRIDGSYSASTTCKVTVVPAGVTYPRAAGGDALSSENLGTATKWTYKGVEYEVYNAFIPSSSYSSWNDAMGFVNALNDANYDKQNDKDKWQLLYDQNMAGAWWSKFGQDKSMKLGDVRFVWTSQLANDDNNADFIMITSSTVYNTGNIDKSYSDYEYGFVVIRGPIPADPEPPK